MYIDYTFRLQLTYIAFSAYIYLIFYIPYETYLIGTKFGGFLKKIPIFSDYQNLGHRHYFPKLFVTYLIMTLSIYYQYSKL